MLSGPATRLRLRAWGEREAREHAESLHELRLWAAAEWAAEPDWNCVRCAKAIAVRLRRCPLPP